MSRVEPTNRLGALVAERPGRATVFDRLRLGFSCGGTRTLAEACRTHGLDLGMVQAELEAANAGGVGAPGPEGRDWREASIGELCAHKPVDEALLSAHEREHTTTGDALNTLRGLSDDYDQRSALCNTHSALLDALAAFEHDLHQHVHEENNILMPRVREMGQETEAIRHSTGEIGSLPRCFQAWIAEQSRGWAFNGS